MNRTRILALLGLALALALSACSGGGGKQRISGKIHQGGKPLEVREQVGKLIVKFEPIEGTPGSPEFANVQKDGSFTVPGSDGQGLPPGKYRIAILQYDDFPKAASDRLKGKYAEGKSPIVRQVGKDSLDIDVDKPN